VRRVLAVGRPRRALKRSEKKRWRRRVSGFKRGVGVLTTV